MYVYPKFGRIVLRSTIIIPEFEHRRVLSPSGGGVSTIRASERVARGDLQLQYPCGTSLRGRIHIRTCTQPPSFLVRFSIVSSSFFGSVFPRHLSLLASIKAAPVAIGIKRPIHESTLFRARLQDLLMVMGARVPVGSRASRSCGDYLRWLFEGQ